MLGNETLGGRVVKNEPLKPRRLERLPRVKTVLHVVRDALKSSQN